MNYYMKWGLFRGYICTVNDDGSVPINALCVGDARGMSEEEAERIVRMHNEQRFLIEQLRHGRAA